MELSYKNGRKYVVSTCRILRNDMDVDGD